jgi:hypothetical protein
MKLGAGWRMTAIAMGVLVSGARDARADVTFPYTFTAGSAAVADQVNQNFQAVNVRQPATLASLAGTWSLQVTSAASRTISVPITYTYYNGTAMVSNNTSASVPVTCVNVSTATMTLTSGGTATIVGSGKSSCDPGETFSISATFTVTADGAGTVTGIPGDPLTFQVSKDLNSMIVWSLGTEQLAGHALRR